MGNKKQISILPLENQSKFQTTKVENHSEPSQPCKMELFAKIVNCF